MVQERSEPAAKRREGIASGGAGGEEAPERDAGTEARVLVQVGKALAEREQRPQGTVLDHKAGWREASPAEQAPKLALEEGQARGRVTVDTLVVAAVEEEHVQVMRGGEGCWRGRRSPSSALESEASALTGAESIAPNARVGSLEAPA